MKTLKIPAYLSRRIVGSLLGLTTSLVAAQNPPELGGGSHLADRAGAGDRHR